MWTVMYASAAACRIDKQWLLFYAFVIEARKDSVWFLVSLPREVFVTAI